MPGIKRQTRPAIVLLIEDDPGDQELTRRALAEGVVKVDLHIVQDGEQAIDYLKGRGEFTAAGAAPRPDLILLDLNMPKVDGREVLRQVKTESNLRDIPVIVLTTSQQETDIVRSYDLGCNSFITKPVDLESFVHAIRELGRYWFELVTLPPK
jgi:CheY-like chemotaxis protein